MDASQIFGVALLIALGIFIIVAIAKAVRIVPQAVALIVERLGKFQTVLYAGMHFLIPFIDRVRAGIDLREQVVSFAPQPVITSDNLVVSIDTVIYFQVTDPKSATYEIANYITGIEQLTVTTLRNVIGSMDLEQTLTSRDQINGQLRGVLDEATTRWGIRVNRVELKAIDPPASVQGAMEQQMRAERDRRAAILTAEGIKQSQILEAEGEKQSAILRAEGQAQAAILRAQGESRAILQVFDAIHRGNADPKLLAYTYLQTLPKIADGQSSKLWVIPTEFTAALNSITSAFGGKTIDGVDDGEAGRRVDFGDEDSAFVDSLAETKLLDPAEALRRAQEEANRATDDASEAGEASGRPFSRTAEVGQAPSGVQPAPREAPRYDTRRAIHPRGEDGGSAGTAQSPSSAGKSRTEPTAKDQQNLYGPPEDGQQ
ncbi:MAG TPA: SPFH domain-containing protein [Actinomycetaceae bacterium]|nr:SPFH domain-containing protein [Actinomycetaceae bacterium]